MMSKGFTERKDEQLQPNACLTCGSGGGNDPSGERGPAPECQDCGGTGKNSDRVEFKGGTFVLLRGSNVYLKNKPGEPLTKESDLFEGAEIILQGQPYSYVVRRDEHGGLYADTDGHTGSLEFAQDRRQAWAVFHIFAKFEGFKPLMGINDE